MSEQQTFTVGAHSLEVALSTAKAFADHDRDAFPALAAVSLTPADNGIQVVATDRFSASRETIKTSGDTFAVLVPLTIVRRLLDLLAPERVVHEMVAFTADQGRVRIDLGGEHDTTLVFTPVASTLHETAFEKVLAAFEVTERTSEVWLDPRRLARACKALADRGHIKVALSDETNPVLLTASGVAAVVMPVRAPKEPS